MESENYVTSVQFNPNDSGIGKVDPEKQEIITKINNRCPFYMYSQAESIIRSDMFPLFHEAVNNTFNRGRIFVLYGDFNTGKSYLLDYVKELIKYNYPDLWRPKSRPILNLDLRDDINTAQQFYLYLLNLLGSPIDPKRLKFWKQTNSVNTHLRDRLIWTLERLETRLLILDECQRLLKAKNQNIPNIFEALKDLTNKKYWKGSLRTQIIMCGTDEAFNLLSAENWIQGRTYIVRLEELSKPEYLSFLWKIYHDYIGLGISPDWDLMIPDRKTGKKKVDRKLAQLLFENSSGRVGLTVDIIKDAVKHALNNNRSSPNIEDYRLISSGLDARTIQSFKKKRKKKKIVLDYNDLVCGVKGCPAAKEPFKYQHELIRHYKLYHPKYIVLNKDGHEIR